jgi:hypothetical protein
VAHCVMRTPRRTRNRHRPCRNHTGRHPVRASHTTCPTPRSTDATRPGSQLTPARRYRECPSITTFFPGDESASGVGAGELSRLELRFDRVRPWALTAHPPRPTLGTRQETSAISETYIRQWGCTRLMSRLREPGVPGAITAWSRMALMIARWRSKSRSGHCSRNAPPVPASS